MSFIGRIVKAVVFSVAVKKLTEKALEFMSRRKYGR